MGLASIYLESSVRFFADHEPICAYSIGQDHIDSLLRRQSAFPRRSLNCFRLLKRLCARLFDDVRPEYLLQKYSKLRYVYCPCILAVVLGI
jgi:hypothetical protein